MFFSAGLNHSTIIYLFVKVLLCKNKPGVITARPKLPIHFVQILKSLSKKFKSCQFTAPRHRIRLAAVSGQRQQRWVSGSASRLPTTEADTDCTEACRRHTERAAGTSLNLTLQGERRGGVGASEAGGGRDGPAAAGGHMGECSGSAAGLRWNCTASLGLEWLRCPWPPRMGRPPASK